MARFSTPLFLVFVTGVLVSCSDSGVDPEIEVPEVAGEYEARWVDGESLPFSLGPSEWCRSEPNWNELRELRLTLEEHGRIEIWRSSAMQCGGMFGEGGGILIRAQYTVGTDRSIEIDDYSSSTRARIRAASVRDAGSIELEYSADAPLGSPWLHVVFVHRQ